MANQIQATVYQIDGNPLTEPKQISFLTSDILMRTNSISTIPEVLSSITYYPNTSNQLQEQTFFVSEDLEDLWEAANVNGTTQVVAQVLEINGDTLLPNGITFTFPADAVSMWETIDGIMQVNATVQFKNKSYGVSNTLSTLVSAANAGGGGGGTNPTSTYMPYNNVGTFADSYLVNDSTNFILKSVYASNDCGIKLDFSSGQYGIGDSTSSDYQAFAVFNGGIGSGSSQLQIVSRDLTLSQEVAIIIDGTNGIAKTIYNAVETGLQLDFANNLYSIGNDVGGGGIGIKIDDANKIIGTTFGAYPSSSVYNGLYLDLSIGFYGLFIDNTNQVGYTIDSFGVAQIGDTTGNTLNGTKLVVDAQNDIISTFYTGSQIGLKLDFPNNFYYLGSTGIGVYLDLDSQKYRFGDWDYGGANGINITIDDAAGSLVTKVFGGVDKGIFIDFNTNLYYFGDFNGVLNNTYIEVHDNNQKINFNSTLGKYNFSNIPAYANNAAALAAGLIIGDIYRSSTGGGDVVHIVH